MIIPQWDAALLALPLDVIGLGVCGRKKVVGAYGLRCCGPRTSLTAQKKATDHSEQSTNPADKHSVTKLGTAKIHIHLDKYVFMRSA